jgi:putative ABC transport system ATP-binding protein
MRARRRAGGEIAAAATRTGARVVATDVMRRYRDVAALAGVTTQVAPGEMVALMGPSGSGKSTLLNLLGALDQADSGSIIVDDVDLTTASRAQLIAHRRRTGVVFQRFNLLPSLTATDNVLAPVLPYRVGFDKAERAAALLAGVGLENRGGALVDELSGGEQQRVAIARALVNHPSLLLADEPTGNLDSATGADVLALIMRLRSENGLTVVVATHDPTVAAYADRVIQLRDGAITDDSIVGAADEPAQLLARINELRG